MLKFTITKDDVSRLKTFKDVIKKAEALSKSETNQLFVVEPENNKMWSYYYTNSAAGFARSKICVDISDVTVTDENVQKYFTIPIDTFVSLIEKTNSDKTVVSFINDTRLEFISGDGGKGTKFTHVVTNDLSSPEEVEDIQNSIDVTLKSKFVDDNSDYVDVDSYTDKIVNLGTLTKFINNNECVRISDNTLSTCDVCYIVETELDKKLSNEVVYFNRAFTPLFKWMDSKFRVSVDGLLFYFNFINLGIELLVSQPEPRFQYPSKEDVDFIAPVPDRDDYIEYSIETEKFYQMLDDFEDVFSATDWKYHQIRMTIDPAQNDYICCSWDDTRSIVESRLEIEKVVTNNNVSKSFDIIFPAVHMSLLKSLFGDVINFTISPIGPGNPGGTGVILSSGNTKVIVSKLLI